MAIFNIRGKYIIGLKGWQGHNKSELLDGEYRPIFSSTVSGYLVSKTEVRKRYKNIKEYAVLRANKKDIVKMAKFNIKYGSNIYKETGRKVLKLLKQRKRNYREQDLWRDGNIKAKTIRKSNQPTWKGDLKGSRI